MLFQESQKICESTVDTNTFRDKIGMMLYSGLEFDGSWQVDRRNGIVALLNMAVDCRLGNRQVVGMDSVKDMLSGTNSIGNNLFVLIELLFVQRNSFAGFNQNGFIFGLSMKRG